MDDATKRQVRDRAGGRCEYCHLPDTYVTTPFQLEHVLARQHRGRSTFRNLAYACLRCNLHKGPNLAGIDPVTHRLTRLFNPRRQLWPRHFNWTGAILVGKTAVGRTTVDVLAMNDPDRVTLRQELISQGLLIQGT